MAKYVQDKQGNVWEDEGDGMGRKLSQEEVSVIGQKPLETFGNSLAVSAAQAYKGGQQLLGNEAAGRDLQIANRMQAGMGQQNPVSNFLGQAAPGALVAVGSAGLGTIPAILADTALGAAYSPDNPLTGAALGAVMGGAPMVAGAIRQAVPDALGRVASQLGDPFLSGKPPRMADRVVSKIDDATPAAPTAPPAQYYKGIMNAGQMDELGIPITPGMRAALGATDSDSADYARKMLWKEGLQGVGEREKRAQRDGFSRLVRGEMGVTDDVALTDTVIGEVLKKEGGQIGSILKSQGNLAIPETTLADLRGVVDAAETGWSGTLGNVLKNVEDNIARNGALTPQGYQNAITRLGEIGSPGKSAGAIMDANKMRDLISSEVESKLSDVQRQMLAESRYRYKIAKTLKQGAGVGTDFSINAKSFGTNWDRKLAQTARGRDRIGQAADTMGFLSTMETNPGTTLQRIMAQAPGVAKRNAGNATLGGLGITGVGSLLFGN